MVRRIASDEVLTMCWGGSRAAVVDEGGRSRALLHGRVAAAYVLQRVEGVGCRLRSC